MTLLILDTALAIWYTFINVKTNQLFFILGLL